MANVQTRAPAWGFARDPWSPRPVTRLSPRPVEESPVPRFRRLLLLLALFALALAAGPRASASPPTVPVATDLWSYEHVPGELLVGFREGTPYGAASGVSGAFDRYLAGLGVRSASPAIGDGRTYRLAFDSATDLRGRRDQLLRDPNVAFAEPNYILTISAGPTGPLTPNDENYKQQWGPSRIGADQTWSTLTTGGPIVIAMLDTGVSPTHPDLKERLRPGYDFIGNDANPSDDNGHGTFTAGIAGASGNNGIGVAGISWGARIMPIKILDQDGRGPVSAFSQGIRRAVDDGAQIVNVSAGIPVPSQAMEAAVAYALGKNVIVVAASGNGGDAVQNYPAAYPNVIAVSASTKEDRIAEFSSYGSYVWVSAPGKDIVSTYYKEGDTYAQLSGTSASTPYVSATIALMLSQRGTLTPQTIREILKATAVDVDAPGFDPKSGYGRLDTFHSVILGTGPEPSLKGATVTPATGKDTDAFFLTAAGFEAGEPVTVWIVSPNGSYRYFSAQRTPQVYASQTGELRIALATSEPLTQGRQIVTAYGERSKRTASAAFEVTKPVNTRAFERVPPPPPGDGRAYFPETGHTLGNAFLRYWQANGGLAIFGFPISEEFPEVSPIDGKTYLVQYFERNRFEYHPENAGTDFEVLLGLLGLDVTKGRKFDPALAPFQSSETRAYFPETKHSLSGEFLTYWRENGGLAVFGFPISEPFQEISKDDGKPYLVQYFERNRFELHPENAYPYNVLLGRLGVEIARNQGYMGR
jgi:subtilisin family serine protease